MKKNDGNTNTILTEDCRLTGTLQFDTTIQINGKLKGKINAPKGYIIVDTKGNVEAEITVSKIDNKGSINGDIKAVDSIHIHKYSSITGNIYTKELVIEKGGKLNGICSMKDKGENIETSQKEEDIKTTKN